MTSKYSQQGDVVNPSLAIVIPCYNRPHSLSRLLSSLERIDACGLELALIISCEGEATESVRLIAEEFHWEFGEKRVVRRKKQMGLRAHVLACGDLAKEFDGLIMLEDDLFVSPSVISFALQAYGHCRDEGVLAGVSLYSPSLNETAIRQFIPEEDGNDVYLMQVPSSWGQMWTGSQWTRFREWYDSNQDYDFENSPLPANVRRWSSQSWKRFFFAFMYENDLYFLYPRVSLTTNFGDTGCHQERNSRFQVPLQQGIRDYVFPRDVESAVRYDLYHERIPLQVIGSVSTKDEWGLIVDLYGTKSFRGAVFPAYLISCRKIDHLPVVQTFGRSLKPHELNIINRINGDDFYLYEMADERVRPSEGWVSALDSDEFQYSTGLTFRMLKGRVPEGHDSDEAQSLIAANRILRDIGFFRHLRWRMWFRALSRFLKRVGLKSR